MIERKTKSTTCDESESTLQVYYNSACPVCDYGIRHQKRRSTASDIGWKDVHQHNLLVAELGRDLPTVRKYLHVRTAQGEVKTGINAFVELWRRSPSDAWLARLFTLPLVNQVAQFAYVFFANGLYLYNKLVGRW